MLMGAARAENVLRALDPSVRESLSPEQESAIRSAVRQDSWENHAVDIRLSFPFFSRGFYIALLAGREQRTLARRLVERVQHPVGRLANIIVMIALMATFGLAAVAVALLVMGIRAP